MYSGGDLVKLLKEKPTTSHRHQQRSPVEEGGKQLSYSPCLAAHLTLLNNLAQHDLNFQNLLVLHNLVHLVLDFGENKRQTDHRLPSWDRRRNCLAELVCSFGKQEKSTDQGQSATQQRPMSDKNNQTAAKEPLPEVVMGYPAAEYGESVSPDRTIKTYHRQNHVSWDAPVSGQDLHEQPPPLPYLQGDWMQHTQWNPWGIGGSMHVADPMSNALYHQLLLKEETDAAGREMIEGRQPQEMQRERDEQSTHGTVLQKCSSWSEAAHLSSSEGMTMVQEENTHSTLVPDRAAVMPVPFRLDQEIPLDQKSDLERFLEAATPSFSAGFLSNYISDSCSDITLDDIWGFYEIPCVYGLQVPFLRGGKSISFAHFVPSLSAIRLFTPVINEDGPAEGEIYTCDVPQYPPSMRLAFEFFETLKPHLRPPLTEEVRNLATVGASAKLLPNLPLSDIHPSSWFSVAWYPIYCIPEGKLRTSFLTYHSLGPMHQVSNCMIGEFKQPETHLIGTKFMALSPDAWNRPQTKRSDNNSVTSPATDGTISESHETFSRNKQDTPPPPPPLRYLSAGKKNNGSSVVLERTSGEKPRDLENKIELLQSNAERLSRANYRLWAPGSGRALDSHKCYHQDFEFFHLRS